MRKQSYEIGARLRQYRKAKKMTQAAVAERLGISLLLYGRIESGERQLKAMECIELADMYGTSCDMILRGTTLSVDAGFVYEKLDALLAMTGKVKMLADEIYDDALGIKLSNR